MKDLQKSFIVPLVIIIAILAIGGGVYVYKNNQKNAETTSNTNSDVQAASNTQGNTLTNNSANINIKAQDMFTIDYPTDATSYGGMNFKTIFSNIKVSKTSPTYFGKLTYESCPATSLTRINVDGRPNPILAQKVTTNSGVVFCSLRYGDNGLGVIDVEEVYIAKHNDNYYTIEGLSGEYDKEGSCKGEPVCIGYESKEAYFMDILNTFKFVN